MKMYERVEYKEVEFEKKTNKRRKMSTPPWDEMGGREGNRDV